MAVFDQANRTLYTLGLSKQVLLLLATELGWIRVIDVIAFLANGNSYGQNRAQNKLDLEKMLIKREGFGKVRVKQIIDALIRHNII